MLFISSSHIMDLIECPRKFFFEDVAKLKGDKSSFLQFRYSKLDELKVKVKNNDFTVFDFNEDKLPLTGFILEKEREFNLKSLQMKLNRYLSFESQKGRRVLEVSPAVNYKIPGTEVSIFGSVDIVFQVGEEVEAVIYAFSKPEFTSAARNKENKPEQCFELALAYYCLEPKYPNLKVSLYYLTNKDDKSDQLIEEYNNRPNKNIIQATFTTETALTTINSKIELIGDYIEKIESGEELMSYSCKCGEHCDECKFCSLCDKAEASSILENLPNSRKYEINLNHSQQRAVECTNTNLRLIASAGTGKTGTLIKRVQHLLDSGVHYRNILLLSFTNKAVDELKERIINSTNHCGKDIAVFTFHSFCSNILNNFSCQTKALTGKDKISILSNATRLKAISTFLDQSPVTEGISYTYPLGDYGIIKRLDKLIKPLLDGKEPQCDNEILLKLAKECYEYVFSFMKEMGLITYGNLLQLVRNLFETYPYIPSILGEKYKYIMVDESQDLDLLQYEMVRDIGKYSLNVCICGDDDQSIYNFKNSSFKHMLQFKEDFDCTDIVLDTNYRSGKNIVKKCLQFIQTNPLRLSKDIKASSDFDGRMELININSFDELRSVIANMVKAGISLSDIAIIARKKRSLEEISYVLQANGIPYSNTAQLIWQEKGYQKVISFLKLLTGKYTDIDLFCLKDAFLLVTDDIKKSLDVFNSFWFCSHDEIIINLVRLCSVLGATEVSDVLSELLQESCCTSFESFTSYLQMLELYGEDVIVETTGLTNSVKLITAHASKGKEFKAVILPNLNEFSSEGTEEEIAEERRVLFVAMTRAKEVLIMADKKSSKSSAFVNEIRNVMDDSKEHILAV